MSGDSLFHISSCMKQTDDTSVSIFILTHAFSLILRAFTQGYCIPWNSIFIICIFMKIIKLSHVSIISQYWNHIWNNIEAYILWVITFEYYTHDSQMYGKINKHIDRHTHIYTCMHTTQTDWQMYKHTYRLQLALVNIDIDTHLRMCNLIL